ncbi:MAG: LytTR family transcriptional regulator [Hyphomicrobiales bacterium]|nr:MAG: LytTR family transcriptional regulator [Hyphomicrobiales bacterium]
MQLEWRPSLPLVGRGDRRSRWVTGEIEGLQIHRSHWVARDAVVKAVRAEGKLLVELSNGMRLPVSRGFAAKAKAAGLV